MGTPEDGLIFCLAGDALRRNYSVFCRGRLETDLCCARDALTQTCSVSCKGRLETELFCVLQGKLLDRFILSCRGCQLPAKANSVELITALQRHLGVWKYVLTY